VLTRAVRADIARMLAYDPLVRLREPLPDGDTAVHQMRVGVRRLQTGSVHLYLVYVVAALMAALASVWWWP